MRCLSYCNCDSYNIKELYEFLENHQSYTTCKIHDNGAVLHLRSAKNHNLISQDVFIFDYGCIVFWGNDEKFILDLINSIKKYATNTLHSVVIDTNLYKISKKKETYLETETDIIHIKGDDIFVMLAFSYGLSQSVKLITFEEAVARTIEENKKLPFELMNTGKTSLSRISLAKKIGSLFAKRHLINLNSSILDTPEFFWKRPKYEPYYKMIIENLELEQRIKVLNDRLDIIHELYSILSDELKHFNSSRLEWIIILLILFEVLLSVLRDILKVF